MMKETLRYPTVTSLNDVIHHQYDFKSLCITSPFIIACYYYQSSFNTLQSKSRKISLSLLKYC